MNSGNSFQKSLFFFEEEQNLGKRGTIVNEWEKLNRISNRRLKYQSLTLPLKMDWSIDRITIVGTLNENIYYHTQNDVLILDFEQLMRVNEGNGHLKAVGNNGWQLVDQHEENIAYIEILKWQEGKGRIDFNPNKISQFLASSMKKFIHDLFLEPHFSRADVACEVLLQSFK